MTNFAETKESSYFRSTYTRANENVHKRIILKRREPEQA